MLLAGGVIARFGSAPVTRATGLALCLALPLAVLAPNLPALVAALAFLGAANGMMDVAMNAHGVAVETRLQRPIMSSLHGMFSLGGLLGASAGALALGWLSPAIHALIASSGSGARPRLAMRGCCPAGSMLGTPAPISCCPAGQRSGSAHLPFFR